jgi:MoaA/NifB/PqqE/SkfB family radical SAM enzyme
MNERDKISNSFELPFLSNTGLVMTYKCQVSCSHCIIQAGPKRKEVMKIEDAFSWIKQISEYRGGYIKFISLTGGEPFYNIESLQKISDYAKSLGLLVTAVTNAFWAETEEKACKILKRLEAIRLLSISTDKYHLKSISLKRVENAVKAAVSNNIPYNISVCTESRDDPEYKYLISELEVFCEKNTIQTAITYLAGRAAFKTGRLNYEKSPFPPISACSSANSPVIFPNGNVIACVGPIIDLKSQHSLVLGNLRELSLNEILDKAEMNPILHAIRVWGPRKLISILEEVGMKKELPDEYIRDSICNTCYALLSNEKINIHLKKFCTTEEFIEKVAYARVYYLKETSMLESLKRNNKSKSYA